MPVIGKGSQMDRSDERTRYDVAVNRKSLTRQELGSDNTRFRVELTGPVDACWRQAYRLVQLDSTDLFRFRLDLEKSEITLVGRSHLAIADLTPLLDRLEAFVTMVNQKASATPPLRRPA